MEWGRAFLILGIIFIAGIGGCMVRDYVRMGDKRCAGSPKVCVGDAEFRLARSGLGPLIERWPGVLYVFDDDDVITRVRVVDGKVASIRIEPAHIIDP
jgi:hypothetical protein